MECFWHLHLEFEGGESVCRNFISKNERDAALEVEQDLAEEAGHKVILYKWVKCDQDTCGRASD